MQRVIAIDFDNTLFKTEWPRIVEPIWPVIEAAKVEKTCGSALILWTCREGVYLEDAVKACKDVGLEFDAINESTPEWIAAWGGSTRKVGASEYWDDKAVGLSDIFTRNQSLFYAEMRCKMGLSRTKLTRLSRKKGEPKNEDV